MQTLYHTSKIYLVLYILSTLWVGKEWLISIDISLSIELARILSSIWRLEGSEGKSLLCWWEDSTILFPLESVVCTSSPTYVTDNCIVLPHYWFVGLVVPISRNFNLDVCYYIGSKINYLCIMLYCYNLQLSTVIVAFAASPSLYPSRHVYIPVWDCESGENCRVLV